MKVLFCNIAYMEYYRGIIPDVDKPVNMTEKSKDPSEAEEQYNFLSGGNPILSGTGTYSNQNFSA